MEPVKSFNLAKEKGEQKTGFGIFSLKAKL
jgi:hypothetical protein